MARSEISLVFLLLCHGMAFGAGSELLQKPETASTLELPPPNPYERVEKDRRIRAPEEPRDFYAVVEDLRREWEYELRLGKFPDLRSSAVRKVQMDENVPQAMGPFFEEQWMDTLRRRGGVTVAHGKEAQIRVDHWIDLSVRFENRKRLWITLTAVERETNRVVWQRTYDSNQTTPDSIRKGLGLTRQFGEYRASIQWRPLLYVLWLPDTPRYVNSLTFGLRGMQRFWNRRFEAGFELNYDFEPSRLTGTGGSSSYYSLINLSLYAMGGYTFIGDYEHYNRVRVGGVFGVGFGFYFPYLAPLLRAGLEMRLGKHWALHAITGYRPNPFLLFGTEGTGQSGFEFGSGVSFLF